MYKHHTTVRVRYAETDQMGYVYYGNYATYFEVARVEAMRELGLSYKALEEAGIMMPVLENYSKFVKPALYDDLLEITVMIKEMPSASIIFHYEIHNEEQNLIHFGHTRLVFVNTSNRQTCRAPESLLAALEPHFT